jgi:hypothetical protein
LRRLALISGLLVAGLLIAAVAQAGKPRLEQKRLRPADVALAKRTTVRAADLGRGWVRRPPGPESNELPTCPGVDMDFSKFTITGTARSSFELQGALIDSQVEVYESRADAVGDFRKATTRPVLRCLGRWLREELAKEMPGTRLVTARLVSRPRLGERAIHYRVVTSVPADAGRLTVYLDLLAFQRGRTAVTIGFSAARTPLRGQLELGRAVAARTR